MSIKKNEAGWLVDAQPAGRGGKRHRKTFKTQAEAKQWDAWLKTQVNQDPKWQPEKRDRRKLSVLIELWYQSHGTNLNSGVDTRARLLLLAKVLNDPIAENFTVELFVEYRASRIKQGVSANTMNHEHDYLRGMFNELRRLGHWPKENPLGNLRRFKIAENELKSLSIKEIELLLKALEAARNPHVRLITKVSLSTGGRWGEIEQMKISQVDTGLIQFTKTKSGRTRAIPISPELEKELRVHHKKHGVDQRIFQRAYPTFKENIHRAGIELPDGQSAHVLRHTFASHFMKNGGNILALQRALGHSDLKMTMRYAHLAPEHLQEVVSMNPLARLTIG